jgi:hypothetical protein
MNIFLLLIFACIASQCKPIVSVVTFGGKTISHVDGELCSVVDGFAIHVAVDVTSGNMRKRWTKILGCGDAALAKLGDVSANTWISLIASEGVVTFFKGDDEVSYSDQKDLIIRNLQAYFDNLK